MSSGLVFDTDLWVPLLHVSNLYHITLDLLGGFGSINKYKLYEPEPDQDNYQEQYDLAWYVLAASNLHDLAAIHRILSSLI
jgi:hypothetical protein